MNGSMTGIIPSKRWSHLKIYLERSGFEKTEIWNSDAINPEEGIWKADTAIVGRVRGQFSLTYKATDLSPSGGYGYVALANIRMIGCTVNQSGQTCIGQSFAFCCSNGNTISKYMICDFTDDCGDGSDERPSTCTDYKVNCDFENGMCNWNTHSSNSSWKYSSGATTLTIGPTRDHTKGE